jgi:3-oxoacyl-(acyl-carrier-protein) synthase
MKRRRVKITGIGPVTPAGIGREEFWKGILEPVSRVRPYTKLGEECGPVVAAYIDRFDISQYVDGALVPKGTARQTLFAIAGTVLALRDAGLNPRDLSQLHCALITGSSIMDFGAITNSIESVAKRGPRGALARSLYSMGISSAASTVNEVLGLGARTSAFSTQCAAGIDAIGHAAEMVATGAVDLAICGGAEAPLHRFPLLELKAAELTPSSAEMPHRIARPFDLWRTTGVVSEGACMFVLEPENSTRRGYSYISGYAFANDEPDDVCSGIETAARLAIAQAGLRPSSIEAINAWGPGHKTVDVGEAQAMIRLMGDALAEMPTVSIKGAIGMPLGASPAVQIGSAAISQRENVVLPTVNWDYPDPACPLNLSRQVRSLSHQYTLLNAHGAGGVNACMVLDRC